jgi:uncharacterized protein (TIGR03067 family)
VEGDPPKTADAPRIETPPQSAGLAELLASDRRRLEGKWSVVKVSQNGREVEESRFILAPMLITRDQIQVSFLGTNGAAYDYRIDPRAKPRAMRVARSPGMMGGGGGVPAWWLYAFEGETLKIALDDETAPAQRHRRPKDFNEVDAEHPITVLELVRDDNSPAPAQPVSAKEEPTPKADSPAPTQPVSAKEKLMPKADAGDDLTKFQGTWKVISFEHNGNKDEHDDLSRQVLIAGNAWIVTDPRTNGDVPGVSTFTLNSSREPKTIDLVATGTEKPTVSSGIYRVEGRILTICYDLTGAKRPTEFDSKLGTGHTLLVLRRVPPAVKAAVTPQKGLGP